MAEHLIINLKIPDYEASDPFFQEAVKALKTSSKGRISGFDQSKPIFSSNSSSDRFDGGNIAHGSSRLKGE